MNQTKALVAVTALALGGAAVIISSNHRSQTALRRQNEALREKLAQLASENGRLSNHLAQIGSLPSPHLPAASMQSVTTRTLAEPPATNLVALLMHGGEVPLLTTSQLERYLRENHRSAASLLAAFHASHDQALLKEAMDNYRENPEVALEAVFRKDASPSERREWLEQFKKAAPENALPVYLSAPSYFKSGQTDQAVQELIAASGQSRFTDYTAERLQNYEEAYRAVGYSEGDAKMAANWGLTLPQLAEPKQLAQEIVTLAGSYRQAGDDNSAQAVLQTAINLGKQLDPGPGNSVPLVTELVGIAVERIALGGMDPSAAYGDGTVQQQLDQLADRRKSIQDLVKQSNPFREQMTTEDWFNYNERTRVFGEENAIAWLINKYGQK